MDVLGRNLERGLPAQWSTWADTPSPCRAPGRNRPLQRDDGAWQQWLLNYLQSCDAVVMVNYRSGVHLSSATAREVRVVA